jgi:hypothetical protein
VVNDKAAATYHPEPGRGYDVTCEQCQDANLFHSLWYDVAERFADMHAVARGHETDIVPRGAS